MIHVSYHNSYETHETSFTPGTGARVAHSVTYMYVGYDVVFAGVRSGFVRWPTVALSSNFLEPIILYSLATDARVTHKNSKCVRKSGKIKYNKNAR